MKQRMQVQGTPRSWSSVIMKDNISLKPSMPMYGYYTGIFQAGCSIWKEQGLKGLYAGYMSDSISLDFVILFVIYIYIYVCMYFIIS